MNIANTCDGLENFYQNSTKHIEHEEKVFVPFVSAAFETRNL